MQQLQQAAATAAAGSGATATEEYMLRPAGVTPATASRKRVRADATPLIDQQQQQEGLAAVAGLTGEKAVAGAMMSSGSSKGVELSLTELTSSCSRLDGCRWFYEVMVLGSKGLVGLKQGEAYGDIKVTPYLGAFARV
jgi:hypothetical protein